MLFKNVKWDGYRYAARWPLCRLACNLATPKEFKKISILVYLNIREQKWHSLLPNMTSIKKHYIYAILPITCDMRLIEKSACITITVSHWAQIEQKMSVHPAQRRVMEQGHGLRPLRHCSKRFEVEEKKEVMRYWKLRMRLLEKNSRAAKITI